MAIWIAMLDVTADFLRANEANLQFVIVHIGDIRAAADRDVKTCLSHLFDGGVLEAAFGQTESELVLHLGNSLSGERRGVHLFLTSRSPFFLALESAPQPARRPLSDK